MTKTTNALFTILLAVAYAIELAYDTGKASAPYIKQAVAFTITCALYVADAISYVYANRQDIADTIGSYFVYTYEAPVVAPVLKAPKYIKAPRIRNTLRFA